MIWEEVNLRKQESIPTAASVRRNVKRALGSGVGRVGCFMPNAERTTPLPGFPVRTRQNRKQLFELCAHRRSTQTTLKLRRKKAEASAAQVKPGLLPAFPWLCSV